MYLSFMQVRGQCGTAEPLVLALRSVLNDVDPRPM
jgi:hypothetical protein